MEPEVKQDETLTTEGVTPPEEIDTAPSVSEEAGNEQYQQFVDKVTAFLGNLPDYLSSFFGQYRRPIVTIALILAAIIAVRLTLAILRSINDIPLLSPLFELIGLGYTAWFVYRYLLRASNRSELIEDFNSLKGQVLGSNKTKVE